MSHTSLTTVLFDMDNTLLVNPNETFWPELFGGVARYIDPPVEQAALMSAFTTTDNFMDVYDEGKLTLAEIWREKFYPALGRGTIETEPQLMRFLAEGFCELRRLTRALPDARRVVELAFEKNLEAVIATGMYLPQSCLEERLAWAGIPTVEFGYRFLTTWNNMHAGKATSAYYRELLGHLGRQPEDCVMVGDSVKLDMRPAIQAGIPGYLIIPPDREPPDHDLALVGQGTLEDFYGWFQSVN